jgi:hypothetical protein
MIAEWSGCPIEKGKKPYLIGDYFVSIVKLKIEKNYGTEAPNRGLRL